MDAPVTDADARPTGRHDVMSALKQAALELLAEQGMAFSIREVAGRANVNHGLVHRHFGSKQELVTAAIADRTRELSGLIAEGTTSPIDAGSHGQPPTAVLLAHLILNDATSLIGTPLASHAVVDLAGPHVSARDPLTAAHRAALANAISLGWTVFGAYSLDAAGAAPSAEVHAKLRNIISELLGTDNSQPDPT